MRKVNYKRFKKAIEDQKTANFMDLKKDIFNIRCFLDKVLTAALESSQAKIERDYNVSSL